MALADGLRWSIRVTLIINLWSARHYYRAAKTLREDIETGNQRAPLPVVSTNQTSGGWVFKNSSSSGVERRAEDGVAMRETPEALDDVMMVTRVLHAVRNSQLVEQSAPTPACAVRSSLCMNGI